MQQQTAPTNEIGAPVMSPQRQCKIMLLYLEHEFRRMGEQGFKEKLARVARDFDLSPLEAQRFFITFRLGMGT